MRFFIPVFLRLSSLACFVLISVCFGVLDLDYAYSEIIFRDGKPTLDKSVVRLPSFSELTKVVGPTVVNILGEAGDKKADSGDGNPAPELPFPFKKDGRKPVSSLDSGFLVSSDGYIVTNNHVIDKADKISVRLLDDKEEYVAEVIGKDIKTDLALIKINSSRELPSVFFGNSDDLKVGDWVLAIGNQFQLGQTVTAGIVSAKSRKVPRGGPYDNFIQTDASINPGSSGGPLFNTEGQVIGIATAIYSPGRAQLSGSGFNIGIGFAIPVNLARRILEELKSSGRVTRGWLGVLIQPVNKDVAHAFNLDSFYGALVGHVMKDSPADKAGFRTGDVIVSYSGVAVKENNDLPLMVANTTVGDKVGVGIIRSGKAITLKVVIDELKDRNISPVIREEQASDELGMILENLSTDKLKIFRLKKRQGALVKSVVPGSIAHRAGINPGDLIETVVARSKGQQKVKDIESFYALIKELPKDMPFILGVRRLDKVSGEGSTTLYLTLKAG